METAWRDVGEPGFPPVATDTAAPPAAELPIEFVLPPEPPFDFPSKGVGRGEEHRHTRAGWFVDPFDVPQADSPDGRKAISMKVSGNSSSGVKRMTSLAGKAG